MAHALSLPNNPMDITQVPTRNPFIAHKKLMCNASTQFCMTNDKFIKYKFHTACVGPF